MSDDLIKRSDAMQVAFLYPFFSDAIIEEIKAIPSADRPQGEWKQNVLRSSIYRYECSNCKAHHRARYDYCPSCGADMRERREDDE